MTSTVGPGLAASLAARAAADGEFRLAARYWTGTLTIDLDSTVLGFRVDDGIISAAEPGMRARDTHIGLSAPPDVWDKVLAPAPPPFFNDMMPARAFGLRVSGDEETLWQYYPAVRRLIDLLREELTRGSSL